MASGAMEGSVLDRSIQVFNNFCRNLFSCAVTMFTWRFMMASIDPIIRRTCPVTVQSSSHHDTMHLISNDKLLVRTLTLMCEAYVPVKFIFLNCIPSRFK